MKVVSNNIGIYMEEYKGKQYLHVRKQYRNDDGELKPTRKGITLSPEQALECFQAVFDVLSDSGALKGEAIEKTTD